MIDEDRLRTIIREEIRAALGCNSGPHAWPMNGHQMMPAETYYIASMGRHSHIVMRDDGSISAGGLMVSPVQSQTYDRSALNGKQ